MLPVTKEKCFYYSFRPCASGTQFTQVLQTEVVQTAKEGENMSFDPTSIPTQHGKLMFIGNILLKDAAVTHRGNYLQYLRKEVLPADTPVFDIKIRHKDPVGNKVQRLTVCFGKSVSTKVAEALSLALCGTSPNPEIFIS